MGCEKPPFNDGQPFKCGDCLGCAIEHQRQLVCNILLEAAIHTSTIFVTLTLDQLHLAEHGPSLDYEVVKKFLKRLRDHAPDQTIIYAASGEYGGRTKRPHYHLILFGFPPDESLIKKAWKLGHIAVRPFTAKNALYLTKDQVKLILEKRRERLARYFTNKNAKSNRDLKAHKKTKLNLTLAAHSTAAPPKLRPPFYHASKGREGSDSHALGMTALRVPAKQLTDLQKKLSTQNRGRHLYDVPSTIRFGKAKYPLTTNRRRKLREHIGMPPEAPPLTRAIGAIKQQEVWDAVDKICTHATTKQLRQQYFKNEMLKRNHQANLNRDARRKIYRGTL